VVFFFQLGLIPRPDVAPFVFFYVGVALSAWIGGRGPGLLAVGLSAAIANYAFIQPYRGWATDGPALTASWLFVLAASIIALTSALFRDTVVRAERAAEALQQQAELLALSHDAIVVWRLDSGIETWNRGAEELYGFTAAEARARMPREILRADRRPWSEIEAALRVRRRWEGELTHTTKAGRTITVSARLQMVRGRDGIERVLESNRDISERNATERRLREADRRKDEFLAVLSHELRNPLAPIRQGLDILERAAPGGEQARRATTVIERQVSHMTRLVSDLLDISRITRGKIQLHPISIDLREVVSRALEDYQPIFATRGIELRAQLPQRPTWVNADPARLAQALGNILHNASKFTNQGGTVSVTLRQQDQTAIVGVRDTGVGIPTAMLARMFDAFAQADCTLDRSAGGLGLGLALVRAVIELHGGSVAAHSDGIGSGAEITLRIPTQPAPAAVAQRGREQTELEARRVLVIEDNVDAAETLKEVLELRRHQVAVAFSGPQGIEKAHTFMPDVVLCDIGLPGMNGYEVARTLRASQSLRDVALVAMTGYASDEDKQRAKEAGFDRHLAKPADLGTLDRVLAELPGPSAS
jgi:PAS domain S-box-containing protein